MLVDELKTEAFDNGIGKIQKTEYQFITDNLKYDLYDWQREALENFLLNEKIREKRGITTPNHLMFNMATGSGKTLVMAALILYYYGKGYRNFIFFVNQKAILGKTEANFFIKNHSKYLFKENIVINNQIVNIRRVEQFSDYGEDIQIKFTSIQKLHNDILTESENSLLLSDLQKRDLVLIGDEAHHFNATTKKKDKNLEFDDISFGKVLTGKSSEADIEQSWETTVNHHILNRGGKEQEENRNVLLEFTATIPPKAMSKYEDKIIIKFDLPEFVKAGCSKHIRLFRTENETKSVILQALMLNWYRYMIAIKYKIANFKPVILFRSKETVDSWSDFEEFLKIVRDLKVDDFDFINKPLQQDDELEGFSRAYTSKGEIFNKIRLFMQQNNYSFQDIVDYIQSNFQERNCIITNCKNNKNQTEITDEETDRLLNSLEDKNNHIRAIFTVERLTEGWDVLNLYDIVRLYTGGRDTNTKTKEAGSTTTSEVQLIGRGVRYCPFELNGETSIFRRFDNDVDNELRILEEFYFHCNAASEYLSELSLALKQKGYLQETRQERHFKIKPEKQAELSKWNLFVNEQIDNPNRRLRRLPEDLQNLRYPASIQEGKIEYRDVNFDKKEDKTLLVAEGTEDRQTFTVSILDFPKAVVEKAFHQLNTTKEAYFSFENLRKRFQVASMSAFIEFLSSIKIDLTYRAGYSSIEDLPRKELLRVVKGFLLYCQKELEQFDIPKNGSEFVLKPFEKVFPSEKTKLMEIDETNEDFIRNRSLSNELKEADWYALDSFWGTSEEQSLVKFIKDRMENLKKKYEKVTLLRNEEVYKIYDYEQGRGFQPDFLLLLENRKSEQSFYQVFIEPKGEHLAEGKDDWKQDFLLEIAKRYGRKKPIIENDENYILIGLPFYNREQELFNAFESDFNEKVL